MPYKDPERKRQWEKEHREQRNERRRRPSSVGFPDPSRVEAPLPDPTLSQERTPDPAPNQKSQDIWIALLGLAVAIGVVLLAVFAGVSRFDTGTHGSGNSGI